ncbi:MAG: hypothetical protein HN737_06940 [Desulfobacterales bacterium]|nr:hypothetical protein [Desulfobacteraceae bacterium]MBT7697130.1 hypothetical protein [Desulfobacterales bacterium]
MQNMKDPHKQRKDFLTALINYGNNSGNFNPHFYKKEMMDILNVSAGEFNIIQYNLGRKYFYYVGPHKGEDKYAINMSECLNLQEQYDQEATETKRHNVSLRLAVLLTLLGAILGVSLTLWLT